MAAMCVIAAPSPKYPHDTHRTNMETKWESVEDFVSFSGGDHAIKKILIANNGIGAIKAIRSIRRWSFETFGNEKMVSSFALMLFLFELFLYYYI